MSVIELQDVPKEQASLLTSKGLTDQFFTISMNERERAENFRIIMDKARELGVRTMGNPKAFRERNTAFRMSLKLSAASAGTLCNGAFTKCTG